MRSVIIIILCAMAVAIAIGCERPATSAASSEADNPPTPRIVSLSPAISRTLIDLDMDRLIVGRTPFCDSLDRSIPVVGDLLDLNYEALVRVRPTHVLVQPPASGINPRLAQLAQERDWSLYMWRLDRLEDIAHLIGELPHAIFEDDLEAQSKALARALQLIERIIDLQQAAAQQEPMPPRTLLLVGVEPVTAFGRDTYLHEILLMVGGRSAIDHAGYPQFTLEDITRFNPEQIILVRPGGSSDDLAAFGSILRLQVDAVRNERLAILTHSDSLLPSSGVIGVAEELRIVLSSFRSNKGN